MGSCFQLSLFSGSSCFCWLCPSCCLPLWVPMPKATDMYQLNPTATTATLCLMVTSQDTVTMAMQHPTDTSPEPDMDTTATLCLMVTSQDTDTMTTLYLMSHMQHPIVMSQEPDMDTMATLYLMATSPDTATTVTLPMSPDTTKPSPSYEPRYGYNGYSSYGYQPTYGR